MTRPNRSTIPACEPSSLKPDLGDIELISAPEKMFDALQHPIVPIVLGGANYSAVFPEMSFINMKDFISMKRLAEYLVWLDENITEYLKYFEWKENFEILNSKEDFHQAHCELCSFLHNNEGETRIVRELSKWWVDDSNCLKS